MNFKHIVMLSLWSKELFSKKRKFIHDLLLRFTKSDFKMFLVQKKAVTISCGVVAFIVMTVLCILPMVVTAEKLITKEKKVISVKIEKGDTLWSIANEYISEEYTDLNSFIQEIKFSNGLTSDQIYEGRYIIVPVYMIVE